MRILSAASMRGSLLGETEGERERGDLRTDFFRLISDFLALSSAMLLLGSEFLTFILIWGIVSIGV